MFGRPKSAKGKKKNTNQEITNNIDLKKKILCRRCHSAQSTHVRVFDHKLLPPEYFYKPDEYTLGLLACRGINRDDAYPNYWVHLPKEYELTKYPYKICEKCYEIEKNNTMNIWNRWMKQ